MKHRGILIIVGFLLFCGCEESTHTMLDQNKQLMDTNKSLELKVDELEQENLELKQQFKSISTLDPEIRLDLLTQLNRIDVLKRTGFYDKDDDGINEKLIVYIRTYDDTGDIIKTAGSVQVQLWDLNLKENALLYQWDITPEELKEMWASTMMTNYYRLTFDIKDLTFNYEKELTVKVRFTDYVTGKSYTKQLLVD